MSEPLTVGVLGAGQLGRMLALAGYPLGLRFRFFDPADGAPAGRLAPQTVAPFDDEAALERFARGLDVITYEFENVPVAAARRLASIWPVYPPPQALEASQDRLREKQLFSQLGIPVPGYAAVDTRQDLDATAARLGLPAVLKTRRFGYDGKGQAVIHAVGDFDAAWAALGGRALILEQLVRFDRELSILAVRGRDGATAYYPLVENHHREGILRVSRAPAPGLEDRLQHLAVGYVSRLLSELGYVGVLALELFQRGDELLANEIAPRVHNSGHWSIEGAETSQFESHVRAIVGWPLGDSRLRGHAAMVNLIGTLPDTEAVLSVPGAHLHLYDKAPRPGRKLGHVTVAAPTAEEMERALARVTALVP